MSCSNSDDLQLVAHLNPPHQSEVRTAAFNHDNTLLATAGYGEELKVWLVETTESGTVISLLHNVATSCTIWKVEFVGDTTVVAMAHGYPSAVSLWDVATQSKVQQWGGFSNDVWETAVSPNGKWIAAASSDNSFKLFEVAEPHRTVFNTTMQNTAQSVDWSPDGSLLALAHQASEWTVNVYAVREVEDTVEVDLRASIPGVHTDSTWRVRFSPVSSNVLATCSSDKRVRVFDWRKFDTPLMEVTMPSEVRSLRWTSDGEHLLLGDYQNNIHAVHVGSGAVVASANAGAGRITGLGVSSDGQLLAACSYDKVVSVFQLSGALHGVEGRLAFLQGFHSPESSVSQHFNDPSLFDRWLIDEVFNFLRISRRTLKQKKRKQDES